MKRVLKAFKYPNYRYFFMGQSISLIGGWMSRVASSWLIYRLTHSEWLLGISVFVNQIPAFLLAPLGGAVADRVNRRKLLFLTQWMAMLISLALAFLLFTNFISVELVLALSFFQGVVNGFDIPARQAFVLDMVEHRENLGNAIALNSSIFNAARLIGPAIAGMIIAKHGEGLCFLADGLSYVAIIFALSFMKIKPAAHKLPHPPLLQGIADGMKYAFREKSIRVLLSFVAMVSLTALPYTVLIPAIVKDIFHAGASLFGSLMAVTGGGALVGALYLATRSHIRGLENLLFLSALIFGFSLIFIALSQNLALSFFLVALTGWAMISFLASANTLLQTLAEEDKRGRVISFYAMAFMGMGPFGSLFLGWLAEKISSTGALFAAGIGCLAGTVYFLRDREVIQAHIHIRSHKEEIAELAKGVEGPSLLR